MEKAEEGVVLERIDALRNDISEVREDIKSVRTDINCNNKSFSEFQVFYTKEHARLEAVALAAEKKVDNHETRIAAIEKLVEPLIFQSRIVATIGGVFLLSILGLLWAVFTHQITLVVP